MNNLLIFFAFPIAVIITSIILEKLLEDTLLVASFVFGIFLIVTFAAFDETFLIETFAYTILSLVTAFFTKLFLRNEDEANVICNCLNNVISDNVSNETNRCNNSHISYNRYKNY